MAECILHAGMGERFVERSAIYSFVPYYEREIFFQEVLKRVFYNR